MVSRRLLLVAGAGWGILGGCLCSDIPDLSGGLDAGSGADAGVTDAGSTDAGPRPCPPDAAGLPPALAYWSMDEGSGTTLHDLTGNGNDGRLEDGFTDGGGDVPLWAQGVSCGGLLFGGDGGFVGFGDAGDFNLTGSMTVSAWFNYGVLALDNDMPIVSKRSGTGGAGRGWELYVEGGDGELIFDVAQDPVNYTRAFGPNVDAGMWHHAVGVYDASAHDVWIYMDGIPYPPSFVDAGAQFNTTFEVRLAVAGGCLEFPCNRSFNGFVDEVRIWNTALSAEQVQAIP